MSGILLTVLPPLFVCFDLYQFFFVVFFPHLDSFLLYFMAPLLLLANLQNINNFNAVHLGSASLFGWWNRGSCIKWEPIINIRQFLDSRTLAVVHLLEPHLLCDLRRHTNGVCSARLSCVHHVCWFSLSTSSGVATGTAVKFGHNDKMTGSQVRVRIPPPCSMSIGSACDAPIKRLRPVDSQKD